jgi:hypothetical protein
MSSSFVILRPAAPPQDDGGCGKFELTRRQRDTALEIDEGVDDRRDDVVIQRGVCVMPNRSALPSHGQHCDTERHHGKTLPEASHELLLRGENILKLPFAGNREKVPQGG